MNALLVIAADFFEHLTNPAFGREVNDSYDFKFHMLMQSDTEAAQQLAAAPLGSDDVQSMSASAWLWYLTWRESITGEQPSGEFLDTLYEQTANPVLRMRIVELTLRRMRRRHPENDTRLTVELNEMPPGWVRDRIHEVVEVGELGVQDADRQALIEDAWELLSYLIDIGNNASLDAAHVLLTEPWIGMRAVRERALALIAQMQLADEDALRLRARLGLQR